MNNRPFFRNQHPSRSVPIHQTQTRSSPKVISVPIQFISSQQSSKIHPSSAAIKIQTLFRGFQVRKSVKAIASIRNEVTEIQRRIIADDLIRRDAKERLKVNETLMSLLFKLDSIRGFDFGVRELRKAVARKAIALQEKLDSIANQTLAEIEEEEEDLNMMNKQVTETSCGSLHHDDDDGDGDRKEEEERREVMVVKLMADNEKMMKLMMQISERNEMQTRMINALSRRVEQLEKAFVAETLKRNKMKKKKTRIASRNRGGGDCIIDA